MPWLILASKIDRREQQSIQLTLVSSGILLTLPSSSESSSVSYPSFSTPTGRLPLIHTRPRTLFESWKKNISADSSLKRETASNCNNDDQGYLLHGWRQEAEKAVFRWYVKSIAQYPDQLLCHDFLVRNATMVFKRENDRKYIWVEKKKMLDRLDNIFE